MPLYRASKALKSLTHIMRSKIGAQFTRRSIGQVIRLLTNLIIFTNAKTLVVLALWTLSLWNFDVETVPMTNRSMETMDRTEEATLTSQGWVPFMAVCNWRETPLSGSIPDSLSSATDLVSYTWIDVSIVPAASLDVVLKGKTSSRLVCLVDAIAYTIAHPERHSSSSARYEALAALKRLLVKIPGPVLALSPRWIHALLAGLFDSSLHTNRPDLALDILKMLASHWSGVQPNSHSNKNSIDSSAPQNADLALHSVPLGTSQVVFHCLTQSKAYREFSSKLSTSSSSSNASPSSKNSDPTDAKKSESTENAGESSPHLIWSQLQKGFTSKEIPVVERLIAIWGPLVLCLQDKLFDLNAINAMFKLLQPTFTHVDARLRALAFSPWSHLIIMLTQTNAGLRVAKRLKVLLTPIACAFTREDNLTVLHAAFETYLLLLSAMRTHLYLDWQVLLAQPLSILLKNSNSTVPFNVTGSVNNATSGNTSDTIKTTSSPSPLPIPSSSSQLSMVQRVCLLVVHLLQADSIPGHAPTETAMASSSSLASGFDPYELFRVRPSRTSSGHASSPEFKTPKTNAPLLRIASMELHFHRLLNGMHLEPEFSSPVWKALPSLSAPSPLHSFLSLVLCLIHLCVANSVPSQGSQRDLKENSNRVLARHLWFGLCSNLEEHLSHLQQQHYLSLKNRLSEEESNVTDFSIRDVSFDPSSIAGWTVLHLIISAASCTETPIKNAWNEFLDEAVMTFANSFTSLAHTPMYAQDTGSSSLGRLCQWLIHPKYLDYPESSPNSTSGANSNSAPEFRSIPFFGVTDLLGVSIDQLHEQAPQNRKDSCAQYVKRIETSSSQIVRVILSSLPARAGYSTLDTAQALLSRLRPSSTFNHLTHLSQDVLASQDSFGPSLLDSRLRISLGYSIWKIISASLRENITNTARIYPQHIYQQSSPTKSSRPASEQKIGETAKNRDHDALAGSNNNPKNGAFKNSPNSKAKKMASDASPHERDANALVNANAMDISDEEHSAEAMPPPQQPKETSTLRGTFAAATTTLPTLQTIPLASDSTVSNATTAASTTKSTTSNSTTPTKNLASSSSDGTDSSFFVTETKHPNILLSSVTECIVHPLQQTKQIINFLSSLSEDTHPGSPSTVSHLLETVFTPKHREELGLEMIGLVESVIRISGTRNVDLSSPSHSQPHGSSNVISDRSSNASSSGRTAIANLSTIFCISTIQLLHQLRDTVTFLQLDATKVASLAQSGSSSTGGEYPVSQTSAASTQASGSKNVPKLTICLQQVRLWYLALWTDVFVALVDGLTKVRVFRAHNPLYEKLWQCKDVIASGTSDLSNGSREMLNGAKVLTSKISAWRLSSAVGTLLGALNASDPAAHLNTSTQLTQSGSSHASTLDAKSLSFSNFLAEDLSALMDLSTPNWSLIWSCAKEFSSKTPHTTPTKGEPKNHSSNFSKTMPSSSAIGSNRDNSQTMVVEQLDFPLFPNMPQPDDTGDETAMSDFSRFMRRIVCCFGMVWRSALIASKSSKHTHATLASASTGAENSQNDFAAIATALTTNITTNILSSGLKMLEQWIFGNNMLLDLLPVMCWAMASDSAAAKVARNGSAALMAATKKPLENLAGATIACISRAFAIAAGEATETNSVEIAKRTSPVRCSLEIASLYRRSASTWSIAFESRRSPVRSTAWTAWNHTFGRVALDPSIAPLLTPIILSAHNQAPTSVLLINIDEWRRYVEHGGDWEEDETENIRKSGMMDVDEAPLASTEKILSSGSTNAAQQGAKSPRKAKAATTKVEQSPSIPVPGTLFPMDSRHERNLGSAFGDSVELDTNTAEGAGHVSPYKPLPASGGALAPSNTKKNAGDTSPSKVRLGNASSKFSTAQRNQQNLSAAAAALTAASPSDATVPVTLPLISNANASGRAPPYSDESTEPLTSQIAPVKRSDLSSKEKAVKTSEESAEDEIEGVSFEKWSKTLKRLAEKSAEALEEENLSVAQLIEAQQIALQLASSIAQRMSKK